MRRLSLKNKRKTLETKETSNSEVKEVSDEIGGSVESSAVNDNSARDSKTRRSRGQPDYKSSEATFKGEEDSDDSNENTTKVSRGKRGRASTGLKTEENGDSLDSAAESNTRGSKSRKSRTQNEIESADTPNKRRKREGGDEPVGREVESILAVRTMKNRRRYKVHWKGLPSEEDSWVGENKLSCPEILQDFLRKQKEKKNLPKPIKVDGDSEEYEETRFKETDAPKLRGYTILRQDDLRGRRAQGGVAAAIRVTLYNSRMSLQTPLQAIAVRVAIPEKVERVIEVRFKKGGKREFLIRWKGFSPNDDTWEPEDHLNCPELITKFMEKVEKAKNVTSRELRANPVMTERLTLNMKSAQLRYSRRPQTQNRPTYHNYLV